MIWVFKVLYFKIVKNTFYLVGDYGESKL